MSHKNKISLVRQAEIILTDKLRIGESKYSAKKTGEAYQYIYAWSTYRSYLAISCRFLQYCKEQYGVKTVAEARQYADVWLGQYVQSAYTQKTYISALAKLYGESTTGFTKSCNRQRANIRRSRKNVIRDKHFAVDKNSDLISFCKATGLRRKEVENIRGNQLRIKKDGYYIRVKGKGGKWRDAIICGTDADKKMIIKKMINAGNDKVWGNVHSNADIHAYRRVYCKRVYDMYARPLTQLPQNQKYYCRKDKKGVVYDRYAMRKASNALGHNRISVIAGHYLD